MPGILEKKLIEKFRGKGSFSREELYRFYLDFEPELKKSTFVWRIHDLKNKNIIKQVKRGLYILSSKPPYKPDISPELSNLAKQLSMKFEGIKWVVWDMAWLNEFLQHQINQTRWVVEVEKGFEELIFFSLRDQKKWEVFLKPDEKTVDYYMADSHRVVIVKKLIGRAPLMKRTEDKIKFYVPTLEKILVDIYAEDRFFYYLQGNELMHVFENALDKYTVDFTRLFAYARRRGKENDIRKFLTDLHPRIKTLLDHDQGQVL